MIDVGATYGLDLAGGDNTAKLQALAKDIDGLFRGNKPLPILAFPAGEISFTSWPTLAYPNLQIIADGECKLNGNVNLDGSIIGASKEPGIDGLRFEGFTVLGDVNITACHRSRFDIVARDTITVIFCILGEFRVRLLGRNNTKDGLVLDALPGNVSLAPTANTFINPIIEGHNMGCWLKNAASTTFIGGTIESCKTAIRIDDGGHNRFFGTDVEGNQTDIYTGEGAHDNKFWISELKPKWAGSWNLSNTAWT